MISLLASHSFAQAARNPVRHDPPPGRLWRPPSPASAGRDWNPFVKSSSACPTDNPNNQNLCAALNQFDTHLRAGRATCAVLPRRLWVVGGISIVPEHFQDDGSSDQRLELGLQGIGFILLVNLIAVDME